MSRGYGDYGDAEENFPNEWAFWEHRTKQALNSKRGQAALAELREALLALPEKRLIAGAISTPAIRAKVEDEPDTYPGFGSEGVRKNWHKADALDLCEREGDGVCAVGAYLWYKRVKAGEDPAEAMRNLPPSEYLDETARLGEQAGLSYTLAYSLASRNDESYEGYTPEERYEKFMGWLNQKLGDAVGV